jgi:hypothetical protein
MKIKHGKDVAPRGNCIIYTHSEYFYSIQIGYDLSCEMDGRKQKCNYSILAWEACTVKASTGYTIYEKRSQLIPFIPRYMTVIILQYTVPHA